MQVKAKSRPSHLVAVVKGIIINFLTSSFRMLILGIVPEAEDREDLTSPWFLFNDFVVNNVSEEEALSFPDQWKASTLIADYVDSTSAFLYRFPRSSTLNDLIRNPTWISVNCPSNLIRPSCVRIPPLPCLSFLACLRFFSEIVL